jgi:hypothetical protein
MNWYPKDKSIEQDLHPIKSCKTCQNDPWSTTRITLPEICLSCYQLSNWKEIISIKSCKTCTYGSHVDLVCHACDSDLSVWTQKQCSNCGATTKLQCEGCNLQLSNWVEPTKGPKLGDGGIFKGWGPKAKEETVVEPKKEVEETVSNHIGKGGRLDVESQTGPCPNYDDEFDRIIAEMELSIMKILNRLELIERIAGEDALNREEERSDIAGIVSPRNFTKNDDEYDCPIHGKLGGIDECPRC